MDPIGPSSYSAVTIMRSKYCSTVSNLTASWRQKQILLSSSSYKVTFRTVPIETKRQFSDFTLYNSLSRQVESVIRKDDTKGLACYTCGPTVYAPAHLGHARTYVCLDIVRRCLEFHAARENAPSPLFVMNITDVDDKILQAATEMEEAPLDLARKYENEFWGDLDALNCLRPHVVTRVTEYVDSHIVPYIQAIVDTNMAYILSDGLYFDVRAFEERNKHVTKYGKLLHTDVFQDISFTRLDEPPSDKRDVRDFVLWKLRKPGERMYWKSPWGEGRPGWHIECSAMIEAVQSMFPSYQFRIHAGGIDLKFPHHTNEIAQAEAYHSCELRHGQEWIPHWVHTGHLHIDGMKMSKSLKNFITIQELLQTDQDEASPFICTADDFRLWCLGMSGSYRSPATFSEDRIRDAKHTRQRIVRFLVEGQEWLRQVGDGGRKKWTEADREFLLRVRSLSSQGLDALFSDLDGDTLVKALVDVAAAGTAYIATHSTVVGCCEPVRIALQGLRELLSLVGFSDRTVRAGLESRAKESNVIGGERALLNELVKFRSAVRRNALAGLRGDSKDESLQAVLQLCDDARDEIFPALGVELHDGKVNELGVAESSWTFCMPPTPTDASEIPKKPKLDDLRAVAVEDYFRVGLYEGEFAAFDSEGIPTQHADGREVSNKLRKKLRKKLERHARRFETE